MDHFDRITSDHEGTKWKVLARTPETGGNISNKVEAIKEFRSRYGAGLKEAKDVVEEYTNRLTNSGAVGFDLPAGTKSITLPGGAINLHISPDARGFTITQTTVQKLYQYIPEADVMQYVADIVAEIYSRGPRASAS